MLGMITALAIAAPQVGIDPQPRFNPDRDGDGRVGDADYRMILQETCHFGGTLDLTADGLIDIDDFNAACEALWEAGYTGPRNAQGQRMSAMELHRSIVGPENDRTPVALHAHCDPYENFPDLSDPANPLFVCRCTTPTACAPYDNPADPFWDGVGCPSWLLDYAITALYNHPCFGIGDEPAECSLAICMSRFYQRIEEEITDFMMGFCPGGGGPKTCTEIRDSMKPDTLALIKCLSGVECEQ